MRCCNIRGVVVEISCVSESDAEVIDEWLVGGDAAGDLVVLPMCLRPTSDCKSHSNRHGAPLRSPLKQGDFFFFFFFSSSSITLDLQ
jgi:hypothetical protein